jgi:hypothetical protein
LAQQITALYVASLSTDLPRWFADGVGIWAAIKLLPKHDQSGTWESKSLEALKSLRSPDDLLRNRLPDSEAGLVGYQFVKTMKKRSTSFDRLLDKLRNGENFDTAFQNAYGSTPREYLANGW